MTNVKAEVHWNKTGQILTMILNISFRISGVFQYGQMVWESVAMNNRKDGCQNVAETNNSESKKKKKKRKQEVKFL